MAGPRRLSWQSAFWGLAGIALNTMFQDGAGYFANMPDLPVYVPRASPIACLADILDTFLSTLRILRTHKLLGALRVVVVLRYQQEERTTSGQTLGGQVRNAIICAIACLQAVKLLSCTGIGWTKTCAVVYVFSWLLELVLRRVYSTTPNYVRERILRERGWITTDLEIRPDPDRPWLTPDQAANTRYATAQKRADLAHASNTLLLGFQAATWVYIVYQSLPTVIDEWSNPIAEPIILDTWFFVKILFLFICVFSTSFAGSYFPGFMVFALDDVLDAMDLRHPSFGDFLVRLTPRRWIAAWVVLMVVYLSTYSLFPNFLLPIVSFSSKRTVRLCFAWAAILLTIYLSQIVLGVLLSLGMNRFSAYGESRRATSNIRRYLAFLVVQVSVTVLYYWRLYDEDTTYKPGWTDWLG